VVVGVVVVVVLLLLSLLTFSFDLCFLFIKSEVSFVLDVVLLWGLFCKLLFLSLWAWLGAYSYARRG
jgi:hypothetical protein